MEMGPVCNPPPPTPAQQPAIFHCLNNGWLVVRTPGPFDQGVVSCKIQIPIKDIGYSPHTSWLYHIWYRIKIRYPPPLRKHQPGQASDSQTGSWSLAIIRRWPSPLVSHWQEIIIQMSSKRGGAVPKCPTACRMCVHILCICPPALMNEVSVPLGDQDC